MFFPGVEEPVSQYKLLYKFIGIFDLFIMRIGHTVPTKIYQIWTTQKLCHFIFSGKNCVLKIEKIVQFQIYLLIVALHEIHHTITTYFWKKWQKLIVDTTRLKSISTIFQVWIEQKKYKLLKHMSTTFYILFT